MKFSAFLTLLIVVQSASSSHSSPAYSHARRSLDIIKRQEGLLGGLGLGGSESFFFFRYRYSWLSRPTSVATIRCIDLRFITHTSIPYTYAPTCVFYRFKWRRPTWRSRWSWRHFGWKSTTRFIQRILSQQRLTYNNNPICYSFAIRLR
ncbi:hypothetical protein BYT27DRAFT_6392214 [Phlegmacium glaucopus]|nr:hypothetical protein BYT27DRAFT_6392214 [Phlegmacium glaucopus]